MRGRRKFGRHLLGAFGDGALKPAERVVARVGQNVFAAPSRVAVELVEREREQRQHARRRSGVLGERRVETDAGARMDLEAQARRRRRLADDLRLLGERRRREIEAPVALGERDQLRHFGRQRPEIGAQRRDHPNMARTRETAQQGDERAPRLGGDRRDREQLLELVDHQDQFRGLVGEDSPLFAQRLGQASERAAEHIARVAIGFAQMRGKGGGVLARREQFRQAEPVAARLFGERLRQPKERIGPADPRAHRRAADERGAADPLRLHQTRDDGGLDQRRLAGTAGARNQEERRSDFCAPGELLDGFGDLRVSAEKIGACSNS